MVVWVIKCIANSLFFYKFLLMHSFLVLSCQICSLIEYNIFIYTGMVLDRVYSPLAFDRLINTYFHTKELCILCGKKESLKTQSVRILGCWSIYTRLKSLINYQPLWILIMQKQHDWDWEGFRGLCFAPIHCGTHTKMHQHLRNNVLTCAHEWTYTCTVWDEEGMNEWIPFF